MKEKLETSPRAMCTLFQASPWGPAMDQRVLLPARTCGCTEEDGSVGWGQATSAHAWRGSSRYSRKP